MRSLDHLCEACAMGLRLPRKEKLNGCVVSLNSRGGREGRKERKGQRVENTSFALFFFILIRKPTKTPLRAR